MAVNDAPNAPFVKLTIISVLVCVSQSKLLQLKIVKHVLKFVEICIGIYYQIGHLYLCFVLLNTFFFFGAKLQIALSDFAQDSSVL